MGERRRLSRRDFFKLAGLTACAGAAPRLAQDTSAPSPHRRPWWVRQVARPTLGDVTEDYHRFSGQSIIELYMQLKAEREGQGAYEAEQAAKAARIAEWIRIDKPGFGLPDRQLFEAAYTLYKASSPGEGLLSWTSAREPAVRGEARFSGSPAEAANLVKAAARLYGAAAAGVTPMNEKYVDLQDRGAEIAFEDVPVPVFGASRRVIPRSMRWVLAIAVQMDIDLLKRVPTAIGSTANSLGYSQCVFVVSALAEFIRGLGYQAIPSVNDTAQCVPFAVEAGLGELGRLNRLITPEFGPAVRLCKVFTDLPMDCDSPVDFGVVDFCRQCRKCAEACPARALSFDDEPSLTVKGAWNNPGHRAWFEDSYRCYSYWQTVTTGCSICLAVCPYTKGGEAWLHSFARATASIAPAADPFLRSMDDAFGYGAQHDPEEWWRLDLPAYGVDTKRGTEG